MRMFGILMKRDVSGVLFQNMVLRRKGLYAREEKKLSKGLRSL